MADGAPAVTVEPGRHGSRSAHHNRVALRDAKRHLQRSALKLVGYLVAAYLVLRLVPTLEQGWRSLEHASWEWVVGAIGIEVLSESGFVIAWRGVVDPERVLERDGRGRRMDQRVAWAQLGGGLLLPGGTFGGIGVGAWLLHRFGMPPAQIAERQFNLSFLNTAVSALAVIVFGVALAAGILPGERDLLLTLLPAGVVALAIALALLLARRAMPRAERLHDGHPKLAASITTLANAIADTRALFRGGDWTSVAGAVGYLGFEVLVLWSAFLAVDARPVPGFAVVVMAYVIGAIGGSLPLPASIGTIGGIAGMLVVYGVDHDPAIAAVLLHQAVGLFVPLTGGAISYAILRRTVGPLAAESE